MILQYLAIFIGSALLVARAATSPTGLPHTGIPALHAVSDRRLRELMAQMNSLMFERFMAAPDIDHKRRIYAPKIADAADKLAATIDVIMLRLPALKLLRAGLGSDCRGLLVLSCIIQKTRQLR